MLGVSRFFWRELNATILQAALEGVALGAMMAL
jgi:hypothetical protein